MSSQVATIFNSTNPDDSMDWVAMSKSMVDMPHRMILTADKYSEHFLKYNWTSWAELGNTLVQSLFSPDSSNPLQ